MELLEWRQTHNKTMRDCAEALGLSDARSYQRYECGAQWPGAVIVEGIIAMTCGEVSADDLHARRIAWLREHRPDVFAAVPKEAAE